MNICKQSSAFTSLLLLSIVNTDYHSSRACAGPSLQCSSILSLTLIDKVIELMLSDQDLTKGWEARQEV